ncbi:MAG TPA: hypothetical protein VMZ04_02160 [Anaerolineae bacterium]|nr:hypothetical protein [Anaerolineae bacterium]
MARRDSLKRNIKDFFELIVGRQLWIQTHDIPDPDALASAEAFRIIARYFGVSGRIVLNGFPNRRENRALIQECKIKTRPLESVKIRFALRSAWAFVDCLPGSGNVTLHPLAPGDIFMAIDHHVKAVNSWSDYPHAFITVNRTAGATATLIGKLLLELEIPFPPRLASALSYAIITDTQDFSRGASEVDLDMYAALFPLTNQKIISRLRNVTKPKQYFNIVHRSLANTYVYRHLAWVFIGEVESGESAAEMADFILSCERITWALALGNNPEKIFLSLRSSNPYARCEKIIHKLVPHSQSTVGGHNQFAGGYIIFDKTTDPNELADILVKRFVRLILRLPKSAEDPVGNLLVEKDDPG